MLEYVLGAILLVVSFICGVLWNGKKEQEKNTEKAEDNLQKYKKALSESALSPSDIIDRMRDGTL